MCEGDGLNSLFFSQTPTISLFLNRHQQIPSVHVTGHQRRWTLPALFEHLAASYTDTLGVQCAHLPIEQQDWVMERMENRPPFTGEFKRQKRLLCSRQGLNLACLLHVTLCIKSFCRDDVGIRRALSSSLPKDFFSTS